MGIKWPGDGEFYGPYGLAFDSSGKLLVADIYRIQVFNSDGTFLREWGSYGTGDGQFHYANGGIAVDALGSVYVADTSNGRIQVFNSDGTFLRKWGSSGSEDGQFLFPEGVAVDASGRIVVADSNNDRIQIFNSEGGLLKKWSSSGGENGQFNYPSGVAVSPSGEVYVADRYANRIQVFNSNGTFLRKWGSSGSGDGQFNYPSGVAVSSTGEVYVADAFNDRIQVFNSNGTLLRKWGSFGSDDGEFGSPKGIALDASGNVFVVDSGNHRVQVFSSDGTFLRKWGSSGPWGAYDSADGEFRNPSGVAVDHSGNVFVADASDSRIQVFNSDGVFLRKWDCYVPGDTEYSSPYGVAVDDSGYVFVTNSYNFNHRLQIFDSYGNFVTALGGFGSEAGQFINPLDVAVDTFGSLYVTDSNNHRVQKFVNAPFPPLPQVTFVLSEPVEPAQQPTVGLSLGSSYGYTIQGQLHLGFTSNAVIASDDPAIQFSIGGRTAAFTIPAGETDAVFEGELTSIAYQTGTVAGSIDFTADSFAAIGEDVTPETVPKQSVVVARQAPVIDDISAARAGSGFSITLVGFSTPREVTRANFEFFGAASLGTAALEVNLAGAFQTWYEKSESTVHGSRFQLRIDFNVQGNVGDINSVSVRLSNSNGTSDEVSAGIP